MKKRILAVIALVLLFGGTTLAFGYWDNLATSQTDQTVVIGEGVTLTVAAGVHADDTKVLVPSGVVMKANDVTSYVITYSVALDTAAVTDLDLDVTASNILIEGVSTYSSLINVNVSAPATINDTAATVTVTVTFTGEPADLAAYTAVATGDITFDLSFTATIA